MMKKSILTIGAALNKKEQQEISGGIPTIKPSRCCNPALSCCTTSHLALNNPFCGGTYISGCQYHPATDCCI